MAVFKRGRFYWFSFTYCGRRIQKSTRQGDREEAKKLMAAERTRLARIDGGLEAPQPAPRRETITVGVLLDRLAADYKLRDKWTVTNASTFRRAREDFGAFDARALTAAQVDSYIEGRLAEEYKPATINRITGIVRQAYQLAVERGEFESAPKVRQLSEKGNERQGFFSDEEFRAVLAKLPEDLRDFARFAYLTGWRKGEVASLVWADVDGGAIRLRPENSKNRDGRVVALGGELSSLMERRKEARLFNSVLTNLVFHRSGQPVKEFRKSWATACVAAGVGTFVCPKCGQQGSARRCPKKDCRTVTRYRGRVFHDCRRSAVRNLVRAGVAERVAMSISGHKTRSIFDRYNITSEADQREAMKKVQEYHQAIG